MRTLVTLVTSACIGGQGSRLTGVVGDGNGDGSASAPVLGFLAQPTTGRAGQVISVVQVAVRDSAGNLNARFTGAISVSLASNSTGAGLSGTKTVRASNGLATFNTLSIDRPGTYTLQASASGAASITSDPFTITSATP